MHSSTDIHNKIFVGKPQNNYKKKKKKKKKILNSDKKKSLIKLNRMIRKIVNC